MFFALLLAGCGGGDSSGDNGNTSASSGGDDQATVTTPDRGDGQDNSTETGSNGNEAGSSGNETGGNNEVIDRTATLSWTAPGTRVNGDSIALPELQEYEIVYGQDPASLDQSVTVMADGLGSLTHTVENLEEGSWYFAIRAIDQNGLSSDLSSVVSKTI